MCKGIKFLLFLVFLHFCLLAQNEHTYRHFSQTYVARSLPCKVQIPLMHTLMRFEDSIIVDIYHYQSYYSSKLQPTNKKDSITVVECTLPKEGWYQVFAFTKQGVKLYETSLLILYKPQISLPKNDYSTFKEIQVLYKSESVLFQTDSVLTLHRRKRSHQITIVCGLPSSDDKDTLLLNIYQYDKKNNLIPSASIIALKQGEYYQAEWTVKKKDLGKYRISFFDKHGYWYGAKEIYLEEGR